MGDVLLLRTPSFFTRGLPLSGILVGEKVRTRHYLQSELRRLKQVQTPCQLKTSSPVFVQTSWACEVVQQVKTFTARPGNLSSSPRTSRMKGEG